MKKYEAPAAEKLEFDYKDTITASNKCGGIYREFTDKTFGCRETPTDNWVHPFTDEVT